MNNISLTTLFDSHKEELAEKLKSFSLPKDSKEVQATVTDFLNSMFENDGAYRQSLTQSEDYILQAALAMLNAQRAMVSAFDCQPEIKVIPEEGNPDVGNLVSHYSLPINASSAFMGSGGGALVGKLLLGGWGAVFGALAGTAVALYLSLNSMPPRKKQLLEGAKSEPKVEIQDVPVNAPALISVISQICESLDNLIDTFRAQIKRVVTKYESQEKPTIERDFRTLLEGIQSLIGYKRGHNPEEDKYLAKLQTRVEDLAEILDNYDLEAVDYTPDHSDWFEAVESKNATEIKMVTPAITKNGNMVIKGKIFIPSDK